MNAWKIKNYDYFLNIILKYPEEEVDMAISKKSKDSYYSDYFEAKKKKGSRRIYAVDKSSTLYRLQKNLANNFLNNVKIAGDVYGFVKGYGYVDYLMRHKSFSGARNYIRLDIKDFFGSIDPNLVREVLTYYIEEAGVISEDGVLSEEEREKVLNYLLKIVLYKGQVIQGAVTSPVISNIIFRQLDIRIQRYCNKLDIVYTRYADDMLFSSYNNKVHSRNFLQRISEIVGSKGFSLNYSKIIRSKGEITLNGYVVGEDIRISRKKLKDVSRVLFILKSLKIKKNKDYLRKLNEEIQRQAGNNKTNFINDKELINYLAGQRAFIISVVKNTDYCEYDKKAKDKKDTDYIDFTIEVEETIKESSNAKFNKKAEKLIKAIEESILEIYEREINYK